MSKIYVSGSLVGVWFGIWCGGPLWVTYMWTFVGSRVRLMPNSHQIGITWAIKQITIFKCLLTWQKSILLYWITLKLTNKQTTEPLNNYWIFKCVSEIINWHNFLAMGLAKNYNQSVIHTPRKCYHPPEQILEIQ